MGEFLRVLLDSIGYLWPLVLVKQYERCVYYFWGFVVKTRFPLLSPGPGVKFRLPFFCEVKVYAVNEQVFTLPRQPIRLQDGKTLTVRGVVVCEIDDILAAELNVSSYTESTHEIAMCTIADYLSEFTTADIEAKSRRRILGTLKSRIQEDVRAYGFKVKRVSFSQFLLPDRTYHVINDSGGTAEYT